jgi:SAM-dependent methyltransferase
MAGSFVRHVARHVLPVSLRRRVLRALQWPPVGHLSFGGLRGLTPIGKAWGADRGQPVDRYYIERFVASQAGDIRGHVLEFKDNAYTTRYGGERVSQSDVLHRDEGNANATIVGDLARAEHIPEGTFDCIICTQTLHFIFEVEAAACTLHRILRPGGVLLVTVPGISQLAHPPAGESWNDYWRFTQHSARQLFEQAFLPANITVQTRGNVLTAVAFLHGLAAEELTERELEYVDADYPLLISVRARKAGGTE